ncbi:MAG: flagellar hook-length control protein FliK [Lachnospiraceae bacterium]|nr:flagellar hook-length control protein FliK [Lachnospiraceae bacterium]
MAISTKGINTVDVVSNVSIVNSKSKASEKATDSFSSIMNMTSNNFNKSVGDDTSNNVDSIAPAKDVSKNVSDNKSSDDAKKTNDSAKTDNKTERADKTVKADDNSKTSDKSDVKTNSVDETSDKSNDVNDIDDKLEDAITQFATELVKLIEKIQDVLEEKLGVSDEDIEASLTTLGLNATDLLNSENVSNVVLDIEGASEVDILIDEQLATLVEDINNTVAEMIQEFEAFDIESADFSDALALDDKLIPSDLGAQGDVHVSLKDIVNKADEIIAEDEIEINEDEDEPGYSDISETADNINDDVKITVNNNVQSQSSGENNAGSNSFDRASESIINNLNNAINEIINEDVEGTQNFTEDVQQADILRQVVDEIKANISTDVTTLDMRLNPESLGRVQITVSTRNGVMEAHIVAENEAAKNAIEANLATLRETFNNQDLKVEAVEVTIANYGFFEEEQQGAAEGENNNNNSRNNRVNSGIDTSDEGSSDEQLETEILRAQGSSVSYSI